MFNYPKQSQRLQLITEKAVAKKCNTIFTFAFRYSIVLMLGLRQIKGATFLYIFTG